MYSLHTCTATDVQNNNSNNSDNNNEWHWHWTATFKIEVNSLVSLFSFVFFHTSLLWHNQTAYLLNGRRPPSFQRTSVHV